MNSKDKLLLDQKVKKKPTVVATKLKAPTLISRRPTFNAKPDPEKLEIREKVDKLLKTAVTRKPKETVPKTTKNEKPTTKLTTTNTTVAGRVSAYDFDNMRPQTTTNAGLKQAREKISETRDNERRLAEINSHFGNTEEFDSGKINKRWSEVSHYPQEFTINNHRATTHGVLPRGKVEGVNPNSEDNNMPSKQERVRGHVRNTSISKLPAREPLTVTTNYETAKLQDITNLKKNGRINVQSIYENSNMSYNHMENLADEVVSADYPKARNLPAKKNLNTLEAKTAKLKVQI